MLMNSEYFVFNDSTGQEMVWSKKGGSTELTMGYCYLGKTSQRKTLDGPFVFQSCAVDYCSNKRLGHDPSTNKLLHHRQGSHA